MPKLGETIVSPALTGKALEVGAKAFEAAVADNSGKVAALEGQVAQLTQLLTAVLAGQQAPAVSAPVEPVDTEVLPTLEVPADEPVVTPKAKSGTKEA